MAKSFYSGKNDDWILALPQNINGRILLKPAFSLCLTNKVYWSWTSVIVVAMQGVWITRDFVRKGRIGQCDRLVLDYNWRQPDTRPISTIEMCWMILGQALSPQPHTLLSEHLEKRQMINLTNKSTKNNLALLIYLLTFQSI